MSRDMTKPTKWLCTQRRLKSAWASAQSDQSSLCAQWVAKDSSFLHADSEDWSDWVDAQADLSLRWAHIPFCRFCHEVAQMYVEWSDWVDAQADLSLRWAHIPFCWFCHEEAQMYVECTHEICLSEAMTILMRTDKICFYGELKKFIL